MIELPTGDPWGIDKRCDPHSTISLVPPFSFSSHALEQIRLQLGSVASSGDIERGGALLGPCDSDHVSVLLLDKWAPPQRLHYRPSTTLVRQVARIEKTSSLRLQGIIHSHPQGLGAPSSDDQRATRAIIKRNPGREHLLFPIVYAPGSHSQPINRNELDLGSARLSLLYRTQQDQRLKPVGFTPLYSDIVRIASQLFRKALRQENITGVDWVSLLARIDTHPPNTSPRLEAVSIYLPSIELLLLAPQGYPLLPPILIATPTINASPPQSQDSQAQSVDIPLLWSLGVPSPRRLEQALAKVIDSESVLRSLASPEDVPLHISFGPNSQMALTKSRRTARQAGWSSIIGGSPEAAQDQIRIGNQSRAATILEAQTLPNCRICIFGLGSVGSLVATRLARAGVGALDLIDPDFVSSANISRSEYTVGDLGRLKTDALHKQLLQLSACVNITTSPRSVQHLPTETLQRMVAGADLVVACTDDPEAQRRLAQFSYNEGIPCVAIGLYERARAGEVLFSYPPQTPCLMCATRARLDGGRPEALNYGTGRLVAEPALGVDIAWVVEIGVRVTLALTLRRRGVRSELTSWSDTLLRRGWSFAMAANQEGFSFFPRIFGKTPGQCGHQTVWMHVQGDPQCPICGQPEWRSTYSESSVEPEASGFLSLGASEIVALAATSKLVNSIESEPQIESEAQGFIVHEEVMPVHREVMP